MMKSWLEEIAERAKKVPANIEYPHPKNTLKTGDRVLGEVPVHARPYFILANEVRVNAKALQEAHEALHESGTIHSPAECLDHAKQMSQLENESETLMGIFWLECRHSIPEASKVDVGIGVRVGWKLVSLPEQSASVLSAGALLAELVGGEPGLRGRG